jgi:hypothetical protein
MFFVYEKSIYNTKRQKAQAKLFLLYSPRRPKIKAHVSQLSVSRPLPCSLHQTERRRDHQWNGDPLFTQPLQIESGAPVPVSVCLDRVLLELGQPAPWH